MTNRTKNKGSICLLAVLLMLGLGEKISAAEGEDSLLTFLPSLLSGVNGLPQPVNFTVNLPNIANTNEYTIDLAQWDIPNNGSQPEKTTDNLQAAIDWATAAGHNRIRLPQGNYLIGKYGNEIYQRGIVLRSNTELILDKNAQLEMATNDKWNYCVIAITGETNVIIRGGTIKGDRATHIYIPRASDGATAHDEGHGICLQGGTGRVLVENMTIKDVTGDGLLLVNEITDVTIRKNTIFNNRRQGVSIVGGSRISISENEIHHINGTPPQFGIDIEGAGRIDRDIIIKGNNFHHNRGGDIVNTSGRNVYIINNVMQQGEGSSYVDGPIVSWHKTDQVIDGNDITMTSGSVNGRLGYIQYSSGGDKGHSRITYVHDNVCHGCGMYMYNSSDADIRRNTFNGYFLSLRDFTNATVIDNQVSSNLYCWSYRIRNTTGKARGNRHNGNPVDLPLSNVPWTTACLQ